MFGERNTQWVVFSILSLFMFFTASCAHTNQNAQSKYKLEITLDKKVVAAGEPILVTVKLYNNDSQAVTVGDVVYAKESSTIVTELSEETSGVQEMITAASPKPMRIDWRSTLICPIVNVRQGYVHHGGMLFLDETNTYVNKVVSIPPKKTWMRQKDLSSVIPKREATYEIQAILNQPSNSTKNPIKKLASNKLMLKIVQQEKN